MRHADIKFYGLPAIVFLQWVCLSWWCRVQDTKNKIVNGWWYVTAENCRWNLRNDKTKFLAAAPSWSVPFLSYPIHRILWGRHRRWCVNAESNWNPYSYSSLWHSLTCLFAFLVRSSVAYNFAPIRGIYEMSPSSSLLLLHVIIISVPVALCRRRGDVFG